MTPVEILLSCIIAFQMLLIYGLINRLLLANRLPKMHPSTALEPIAAMVQSKPKATVEHPKREVVEKFKVGV